MKDRARSEVLEDLRMRAAAAELVEVIPDGQETWTREDRYWKRQRAKWFSWFRGKTGGKGRA